MGIVLFVPARGRGRGVAFDPERRVRRHVACTQGLVGDKTMKLRHSIPRWTALETIQALAAVAAETQRSARCIVDARHAVLVIPSRRTLRDGQSLRMNRACKRPAKRYAVVFVTARHVPQRLTAARCVAQHKARCVETIRRRLPLAERWMIEVDHAGRRYVVDYGRKYYGANAKAPSIGTIESCGAPRASQRFIDFTVGDARPAGMYDFVRDPRTWRGDGITMFARHAETLRAKLFSDGSLYRSK